MYVINITYYCNANINNMFEFLWYLNMVAYSDIPNV